MRTFTALKDLPVLNIHSGNEIGRLEDLCVNQNGDIAGIVIDPQRFFKRPVELPLSVVVAMGTDSLLVRTGNSNEQLGRQMDEDYVFIGKAMVGKPIYSSSGQNLGLLEDVYFNQDLGKIIGYEITDGFFADFAEGRKVLEAHSLSVGEDAIVVT